MAHPRLLSNLSKVYRSARRGFPDVSEAAGIPFQETHRLPAAADFEFDGFVDLAITAGYPAPDDFSLHAAWPGRRRYGSGIR